LTRRSAADARHHRQGVHVASREELDAVIAEAARAGAVLVEPAQATFWGGYAGYFQDSDQHPWELAFNPDMLPE
jgi:uncharacterized glyoxalase superfamily protein PhnB